MQYAEIIVDTDAPGLSQPFTYRLPAELEGLVSEGDCVSVPFAGRDQVGFVLRLTDTAPDIDEIKDVASLIPDSCTLNPPLLRLAEWLSSYYAAPLAHGIRAMVPEVMSATISSTVRLIDAERVSRQSPAQRRIVEALEGRGGAADADVLKRLSRVEKFSPALKQLKNRGVVEVVRRLELPKARPLNVRGLQVVDDEASVEPDELEPRAPKQAAILRELSDSQGAIRQAELLRRVGSSTSPAKALVDKGIVEKVDIRVRRGAFQASGEGAPSDFVLTPAQENALRMIRGGLESAGPRTTLLHGVTGSGKTEVYLRSIAEVLERGGSCIALVPEISLTTHLTDAFISTFGERLGILHSRLSVGERHDEWRRIEAGEARVVLGPRSAVFAPVRDLGLIVMDEEHEPSYKQEQSPRYNARSVAEQRARIENASLVLGSATPSVETYFRAKSGDIELAVLDERIDDRPMPTVHTVDLRTEFEQGRRSFFSERLEQAVAERLAKGEKVILFVNRRGFATFILCRSCGYTARCTNCDVSLTYHAGRRMLRCHHCNQEKPAPTVCPQCGGVHIRQFGVGTERVEAETRRLFPDSGVIRMDSDTTTRKGSHARLLEMFQKGEARVLVGTQMIAKGFDFPDVTLVGVISADTSLHLPDFRSAERTFQLLTQVSGRAGRGDVPGEVIVQSFSPDHYAVEAASRHDYEGFYESEIACREELGYPPFSRLINIVSSDAVDSYAQETLEELASGLAQRLPPNDVRILGPSPCPLAKLKGLYRWHIVIKNSGAEDVSNVVQECMADLSPSKRSGVSVDVDPVAML